MSPKFLEVLLGLEGPLNLFGFSGVFGGGPGMVRDFSPDFLLLEIPARAAEFSFRVICLAVSTLVYGLIFSSALGWWISLSS